MPTLADRLVELELRAAPPLPIHIPTEPLFHYTDANGLLGILTSHTIRATHFQHLNDREELLLGERTVREAALEVARGSSGARQAFAHACANDLERVCLSSIFPPYIASFSEDGDLLSQWRAYAAAGAGYSIGFVALVPRLEWHTGRQESPGVLLLRCEYSTDPIRVAARSDIVDMAYQCEALLAQHGGEPDGASQIEGAMRSLAVRRAALLALRAKHSAFREEREWRLVACVAPQFTPMLEFRPTTKGLAPYLPIPLVNAELKRLFVGPSQSSDAGVVSARTLLVKLGKDPSVVVPSAVPFRA